ncbi:MAG: carboxypeptidase-like regulatory domain-containing protein [Candidatus Levyibacteriota bacterium]
MVKKLFFLVLFLLSATSPAFAADVKIAGKILDQKNNPVAPGIVLFVNAAGKTVAAANTDPLGYYEATVPAGTYTISAQGPKALGLEASEFKNKTLSSSSLLNFTLKAPETTATKKSNGGIPVMYLLAGGIILVMVIIGVAFFVAKNKKTLPQPGSSD